MQVTDGDLDTLWRLLEKHSGTSAQFAGGTGEAAAFEPSKGPWINYSELRACADEAAVSCPKLRCDSLPPFPMSAVGGAVYRMHWPTKLIQGG